MKYKKFTAAITRVLFIDSSFMLSKECINAIINTGNELKYIHIDADSYNSLTFRNNLLETISSFKPDFVLSVNHYGYDKEGTMADLFNKIELPYVSWFVDSPDIVLSSYNTDDISSDFLNIFVWDDYFLSFLKSQGYKNCYFLPLATDTDIFYPKTLDFIHTVSFVGSSLTNVIHKNMKSWIHRDDMLMKFLQFSNDNNTELINNYIINLDKRLQKDFQAALLWKQTQNYRLSCLSYLKKFNATISGDPNWTNILPQQYNYIPERWYYDNLNDFYNGSTINFNTTSLQMPNAVNQRVFDVSACKKFLITDYKQQIASFFQSKDNMVWYEKLEEIPDLITYYLKNTKERDKIAENAYNIVVNNHTYKHRLNKMIEILKNKYKDI